MIVQLLQDSIFELLQFKDESDMFHSLFLQSIIHTSRDNNDNLIKIAPCLITSSNESFGSIMKLFSIGK